jgi:hypothetical protein
MSHQGIPEDVIAATHGGVVIRPPTKSEAKRVEIQKAAGTDLALERLLDKLSGWLRQQPEWADLMTAGDRNARKRAAGLIAKEIMTIPARSLDAPQPNRAMRRRMAEMLREQEKEVK